MPELRAPDPTLDALRRNELVRVEIRNGDDDQPRIAHGYGPPFPRTGHIANDYNDTAGVARWFAVPCRECFPDAPPPGHEFWTLIHQDNSRTTETRPAAGLSWQMGDA